MITDQRTPDQQPRGGRAWGWVSGLGWLAAPWIAAGIVSTFLPDPERSFPAVFVSTLVAMIGWLVYGSIRIDGFRAAAVKGMVVASAIIAVLVALLRTAS